MEQQVLGGRYLLKDKVGSGGMATVYRAQDQVLDRTVAVKIMLPQYAADATFAARFKQEAQAAAGLQSPYIVGVYDWGKEGDTYYIVMEYLRGTDLKSGIRSHGALDPKKVAQIGSQICAALSVAHKHEIIHRDIKPQNIMVQPDGNIKVMDFGIARAKNSHLTQDNNVLGTAHYVSPEQTRGQELGPTSDIYSLGVVMYECATGKVPFDGDDAISVALKQVNELPVPPSQVNPGVDADLERIILRCMEKDPANRFQTADELRQVLNSYLAGRTVDVPEPTRVISAGVAGVGATETRVMSDQTRAMARPAVESTRSAGRAPLSGASSSYEEPERSGGKGKIVAGVILVIALLGVIVAFAVNLFGNSATMVDVPNVIGMTEEEARSEIESAGFTVGSVDPGYSDEYDEGEVMDQTPKGDNGQQAPEGSEIDITVSRGPSTEQAEMPDLMGRTRSEAESMLQRLNITYEIREQESETDTEDTVIDQSRDAGEMIDEGETVTVTVAVSPDSVEVPDLTDMTESQARSALSDAGFGMNIVAREYSGTVPEGTVIRWNPSGRLAKDTTIDVVISRGPESTSGSGSGNNGGSGSDTGGSGSGSSDFTDADASALVGTWESNLSVPDGITVKKQYEPSNDYDTGMIMDATLSGNTLTVIISKGSEE
ncbi:Stk1 family PASTA domain-containing Ser/Thr kinase [Enorma phocaeensis]|uniref:Stk1 family PASTA domain-containing Ser/Thr kinase n=1 Tax=Enorma phocaeensis TaxID=1871019 RepID=UPI001958D2E2|nr:Stk1 family PASTA domain-containing Ser/Thr kinase [Enorma phocaeensis]MBM6953077.1 Stk1 family PASTA domain-containing Ser/Thr kinase [Enorma phocaeensis]